MSENDKYIIDDEDRAFFDSMYVAIAGRLNKKRLWRGPWKVEINDCVYKFTVTGYAKKGSEVWKEQQEEFERAQNLPQIES